jgi:hypothetical protein
MSTLSRASYTAVKFVFLFSFGDSGRLESSREREREVN